MARVQVSELLQQRMNAANPTPDQEVGAGELASGHLPAPNATAASLLGFLHDGPQSGWELTAAVQNQLGGFWSISRSQVHRELKRLADSDLVETGEIGVRDSLPYRITPTGRDAFAAWVSNGPESATIRLPLLLFVSLGRHLDPDVLASILREQRAHQAALVREYSAARRQLEATDVDQFRLATIDFGIRTARTTVKWIDELIQKFEQIQP
ncbi:MAG: PadR family transcriptional regulator [Actinomycetales bacterium]|nr:PadR family transcriptional regulator [Actinomycetales bacterium]